MHYVIIGNSAAAIGAAESIRAVDRDSKLTIVGDEPRHVYSRPLISHFIAGKVDTDQIRFRPLDFYKRLKIDARLGVRAESVDVDAHAVTLADGKSIHYDKLLLATGSVQGFLPIKGREHAGIFDFWTLSQAEAIRDRISGCDVQLSCTAVVICAGLVGIQAAYGLRGAGMTVVLIEPQPFILSRLLDAAGAAYVQGMLERGGVRVLTGRSIKEIQATADEGATSVVMDNGERIECGLVINATDGAPNLALVRGSSIRTNRGVTVDEHFQTNVPDVYAAGDVAEAYDVTTGRMFVSANWPNAHAQGRVAGSNMAGFPTAYTGSVGVTSMPLFGKAIASQGIVEPEPGDEVLVRESHENQVYQKMVFRKERLIGAVMVGDVSTVGLLNHFKFFGYEWGWTPLFA
ncbi:MAG: FAD-dependent oxidoreductase [Chloroflexi bacterium]|nr:FAD-dependent oxidoreductase [Chloroflexota bacterium]